MIAQVAAIPRGIAHQRALRNRHVRLAHALQHGFERGRATAHRTRLPPGPGHPRYLRAGCRSCPRISRRRSLRCRLGRRRGAVAGRGDRRGDCERRLIRASESTPMTARFCDGLRLSIGQSAISSTARIATYSSPVKTEPLSVTIPACNSSWIVVIAGYYRRSTVKQLEEKVRYNPRYNRPGRIAYTVWETTP